LVIATDHSEISVQGSLLQYGRRGGIFIEQSHGIIKKNNFKRMAFDGADNTERAYGICVDDRLIDAPTTITENVMDSINLGVHSHWSGANSYITKNKITTFGMTLRDCGAIYVGSDATNTKYIKQNIINNAVNDLVFGLYIDYVSQFVVADSNTISNTRFGIHINVSLNNTLRYNNLVNPSKNMDFPWNAAIRLDEHFHNLNFADLRPITGNNIQHNNIVLGTGENENAIMYFDVRDPNANIVDNNKYFDPFSNDPLVIVKGIDWASNRQYTIQDWNNETGMDGNSTFNPTNWVYNSASGISKEEFVLLLSNPTNQDITYDLRPLAAEYIDVNAPLQSDH
jgi:hypothetical protein